MIDKYNKIKNILDKANYFIDIDENGLFYYQQNKRINIDYIKALSLGYVISTKALNFIDNKLQINND